MMDMLCSYIWNRILTSAAERRIPRRFKIGKYKRRYVNYHNRFFTIVVVGGSPYPTLATRPTPNDLRRPPKNIRKHDPHETSIRV